MNKIQNIIPRWFSKSDEHQKLEAVYSRIFEEARRNLIQKRFDNIKHIKVHLSTYGE